LVLSDIQTLKSAFAQTRQMLGQQRGYGQLQCS